MAKRISAGLGELLAAPSHSHVHDERRTCRLCGYTKPLTLFKKALLESMLTPASFATPSDLAVPIGRTSKRREPAGERRTLLIAMAAAQKPAHATGST